MSVKITDLVSQEAIDQIKDLDTKIRDLIATYSDAAKELGKGLEINVKVAGDLDSLEKLFKEKSEDMAASAGKLNSAIAEQGKVIANTTPTISRMLMEQERINKTQREAYTEHAKVKELLERYNDTYDEQVKQLVKLTDSIKKNKDAQKENSKAFKDGAISYSDYSRKQVELISQHREMIQQKRKLEQVMTAEEKAVQSGENSYNQLSQQLELLKKVQKDLAKEGADDEYFNELETAIQNLDAHLKDLAADMGEFHRNVGNYAIAGQNGVVSTESLNAALVQEARTTQDLADQTRILEEAKRLLNTEDANYQATLAALNAKIEENKSKLSDVSDILGKQASSVAEAEAQNKRLSEALKHVDVSSEGAKEKIKQLRDQISANNAMIAEATGTNEKFADSMLNILGLNLNVGSSFQSLGENGNIIEGLSDKCSAFWNTLKGIFSNPWVLAFLGIAGAGAAFKWWYDFNKGLAEASHITENYTGLAGEAADKITAEMSAVADHIGKSYDQTIGAANTLVQQFGLTWEQAIERISDGIEAGADMNGRLLENINQFGPALRDMGVSAEELIAVLSETRNGIFDEKGVQDIVKGGTRLRNMTKQLEQSLDAVGISSKQMQKDLAEGNITMLDAVQQVAAKLKELPENSQEAGAIMKNVFGRTAAEGGTLLIQSIADVNTNLEKAKDNAGELFKLNREQLEAQKKLNDTLCAVFKMSGTSFQEMTTKAKTFIIQGLTKIIVKCVDIVNWFIRMYNKSAVVRYGVQAIGNSFKTLWTIAKFVFNQVIDSFKATGTILEGIFTMDWDLVKKGWQSGISNLGKNLETMIEEIASNTADAWNKTIKDELKEVSVDLGKEPETSPQGSNVTPKDKSEIPEKDVETDSEKKAREKRAKDELKLIQELEESKIAVMADNHEKELATIRLNFKKKLETIKGNGATEEALRLQLALQCQQEIEACELRYQTELSKINLENRLASVEKGSKEELDLRLAQLEANREAEIKAAEKTGADVALINEKFNREKMNLENEYAGKLADNVMERYATEELMRNKKYSDDVNALKLKYAKELALASGNSAKQEQLRKELDDELYRLQTEYSQDTLESTISMIEEILNLENLSAKDRLKWEKELAKAKIDLNNQVADSAKESADRQADTDQKLTDKRKANTQTWLQAASEAMNNINELVSTLYDAEVQKIEEKQEANEKAADEEQERITRLVDQNVITEEEGEARKRAAEALSAKKNEELEKKKQQLKYKQAIWDKANSVAQIGISTALAIMKAMEMTPPASYAMAAVAGAMGAIQLATVLATPIPKYAKGTSRHGGGPAIVGDGGRAEVVTFRQAAWITPDAPTLVDLPAGASVYPSIPDYEMALPHSLSGPVAKDSPRVVVNNDFGKLEEKMDRLIFLFGVMNRSRQAEDAETYLEMIKIRKGL